MSSPYKLAINWHANGLAVGTFLTGIIDKLLMHKDLTGKGADDLRSFAAFDDRSWGSSKINFRYYVS
jgi:hypothetical protein